MFPQWSHINNLGSHDNKQPQRQSSNTDKQCKDTPTANRSTTTATATCNHKGHHIQGCGATTSFSITASTEVRSLIQERQSVKWPKSGYRTFNTFDFFPLHGFARDSRSCSCWAGGF
eukprot:2561414-Amphidinium_carterae.3